jgi:hypothetical protein
MMFKVGSVNELGVVPWVRAAVRCEVHRVSLVGLGVLCGKRKRKNLPVGRLFEAQEKVAGVHGGAGANQDFGDAAGLFGVDGGLHLHRLKG